MVSIFTQTAFWLKWLLLYLFLGLMLFSSITTARAQDTNMVSGTVISAEEGPLPGVNVRVKGTNSGTITNLDGEFSLEVPSEAILVFSFIGFLPQEVEVNGRSQLEVVLQPNVEELEEVVVIGYGTQRKRDVTGAIVSIKGEEIADKPVANPLSALQGNASGVTVTNSGVPGESPTIRIRGVGSINGVDPLYVVDGIFTNNIDYLNPNDIASIEVLKDASSLAMFGVQGANGVIIITTKRAREGETIINLHSYAGFQQVAEKIDVANAGEFKMLYNEQLANIGQPPFDFSNYTANTDWQDLIFQRAFITNNSVSIRSGTERNQATFSLNYFKQEGIVKYNKYSRFTASLRDEFKVRDHIKIGGDVNFSRWDREPPNDSRATSSIMGALRAAPVFSPMHESGVYNSAPSFQRVQVANPVALMEILEGTSFNHGYRFVGSVFAEVDFLKNFNWRSTFYSDLGFTQERGYTPVYSIGYDDERVNYAQNTEVRQQENTYSTWQMDNTLTYTNTFANIHDITVLLGLTSQYRGNNELSGSRQGGFIEIPNDPQFWYLGVDPNAESQLNDGEAEEQAFLSYLFRTNYAYAGKYLLNVSFRRDGTSKFGPNQRWGNFPSVGAGWVLSEENFMKDQGIFDFIKLKGSWGRLGNEQVGNYLFYPVLSTSSTAVFGDRLYPGVAPEYIANPDIRWEIIEGLDVGLELYTLNNRLNLEVDYYKRESQDILTFVDAPGAVGADQAIVNAGTILNRGFEFSAAWSDEITENLGYRIRANATTIHNEVLAIGDVADYAIIEGPSRTQIGQPVGAFYGYVMEGIFQTEEEVAASPQAGMAQPGDIRFRDVNQDGEFDDEDRDFLGSPTPTFTYGASLGLTYRNFTLEAEVQGVGGNYIFNNRATANFAVVNYPANRLNRWTGPNTSNDEPIMDNTRANNFETSSYFLEPGDYFRIRNLSLGYNFSEGLLETIGLQTGRVYVNVQNLKTFTRVTGYTPEVGGSPVSFGVDNGTYPLPVIFTAGININF